MIRLFKQYCSLQGLFFFLGESLTILAGVLIYTSIHLYSGTSPAHTFSFGLLLKLGFIVLTCQIVFHYMELYKSTTLKQPDVFFFKILQSLGVVAIIFSLFTLLSPGIIGLQGNPLSLICFVGFLVLVWRFLGVYLLDTDFFTNQILVIGTGKIATNLIQEVEKTAHRGMEVIGFIDKENTGGRMFLNRYNIMGIHEALQNIQNNGNVKLIVALDDRRGNIPLNELVECKVRGVEVEDHVTFMEKLLGKLMVESLNPSHLIFTDGFRKSRTLRTVIEMITAFFALLFLSPLILLVSLLIKLDSKGPVLFRQERVGENGRLFYMCKFRSMQHNAEDNTGPVWAKEGDERVTRMGRFIRKFRIDEIPQLWNVLKGEMSFVGPRPERLCFVNELSKAIPYYNLRHTVKPGISGWAQVRYRYGATLEDAFEKLRYDLYYIKHRSPLFELFILFETVKIVLFGEGAR